MTKGKIGITVLISGGGTNLQAIIDAIESGSLKTVKIDHVISSNENAYGNSRAIKHNIPLSIIKNPDEILSELRKTKSELLVLAGYLKVLPPLFIEEYEGKIINIHPSLIPKHCGKGFYGMKVHESVIESGDKITGATVHFVDKGVDTGEIILQREVFVLENDTAEILAKRVLKIEHEILIEAIERVAI